MHQADESPFELAIPETPLRAIELNQSMAANPAVARSVYALCELLKVCKFHGNVEPIQHVLDVRRNLPVNCSQPASPSVRNAIEVVSLTPHCWSARPTALFASKPPFRTKAKRVAFPSQILGPETTTDSHASITSVTERANYLRMPLK